MDKIAIEQNTQGSTYRPGAGAGAKALATLGSFAVSFEDLLQRVGAKIENAFSAADKSHGIVTSRPDEPRDPAPADKSSRTSTRDDNAQRADNRGAKDDGRKTNSADRKRTNNDSSDSDSRADASSSRTDRADNNGSDDVSARDTGNDKSADTGNANDGKVDQTATDNSGKQNQDTNAGAGKATHADASANDHAAEMAGAAAAAAMQLAGIVGQAASANAQGGDTQQGQQAQAVGDTQQSVNPGALAQAQQQYGAAAKKQGPNTHEANGKVDVNAGGADHAAKAAAGPASDVIKDQVQKLSQVIGKGNSAQVNVTVQDDKSQFVSKPTTSLAGTVSLAADETTQSSTTHQQQAGAQNQNAGRQNMPQVQAAVIQQVQAQQQPQGPQGAGAGAAGAGSDAASGIRAAGSSIHGAGGDQSSSTQLASGTQTSQQTSATRETSPTHQAQQAQRANLPGSAVVDQISVKITKAMQAGTDKISIQLKPAELGRVDVKLEMTHDGRVMTVVTAERQETLDLLRRDQAELQRALADAGLQSGDMEFNLKGQEQRNAENEGGRDQGNGQSADAAETTEEAAPEGAVLSAWESGIYFNGRLDLRA